MCGGTWPPSTASVARQGLSPRVRGNLRGRTASRRRRRSIPACAGEPLWAFSVFMPMKVYPRVCGGTARRLYHLATALGLSPRVRGNPSPFTRPAIAPGSIPACAGEPPPWSSRAIAIWVYPRVCGGTPRCRRALCPGAGLSPRVRGNPIRAVRVGVRSRSIPACAGEPAWTVSSSAAPTVYPRVCGGTPLLFAVAFALDGLSPCVRGNHSPLVAISQLLGSIPACAGEPKWPG